MKKFSDKNRFSTSSGESYTRSKIEVFIREGKRKCLDKQLDEKGYNFCSTCNSNFCQPVTVAHRISVDECLKSGRAELAWDWENNMDPVGMHCHQIQDKNNTQFNKL